MSLYAADGAPLRSFPLPSSLKEPYGLAFDSRRIVIGGVGEILAFDTSGNPLWKFQTPQAGEPKTTWQVFLIAEGKELRLYDGVRTIYRYAMP